MSTVHGFVGHGVGVPLHSVGVALLATVGVTDGTGVSLGVIGVSVKVIVGVTSGVYVGATVAVGVTLHSCGTSVPTVAAHKNNTMNTNTSNRLVITHSSAAGVRVLVSVSRTPRQSYRL
jgi:hypothetical protein